MVALEPVTTSSKWGEMSKTNRIKEKQKEKEKEKEIKTKEKKGLRGTQTLSDTATVNSSLDLIQKLTGS